MAAVVASVFVPAAEAAATGACSPAADAEAVVVAEVVSDALVLDSPDVAAAATEFVSDGWACG
jgi:hypothetical protein